MKVSISPLELAERYSGIRELAGGKDHPLIQWWLSLCFDGNLDLPDETPWCSAFVNGVAWELRLPRSKSAAARSWLTVGTVVNPLYAVAGADVVILKRGAGVQPGPEVTSGAPGHVGFYVGSDGRDIMVRGGNQSNSVSVARFPADSVLGVRRIV